MARSLQETPLPKSFTEVKRDASGMAKNLLLIIAGVAGFIGANSICAWINGL